MTTTLEEIQNRIQTVLTEGLSNPVSVDQVNSDTAIVEKGIGLDSVSLLEFVVGLENEFDILLDDSSLTVDNFSSFQALAEFIQSKLSSQSPKSNAA